MQEAFLQHIWKYGIFDKDALHTADGEKIEIISPGYQNIDAGPDFFNAKIKINDTLWVGNVEIHIKSSDWNRHLHSTNKSYDNVILHVVYQNDAEIKRTTGETIQTVEIKFNPQLLHIYNNLMVNKHWVACNEEISKVDPFIVSNWISALLIERLKSKTTQIIDILTQSNNHWEEVLYIKLATTFGLKVNQQPFEMLARHLPIKIIAKHKHSLFETEALLFGQAGMLNCNLQDEYSVALQKEYTYLKAKYNLVPIDASIWKYAKMRPSNFPTIRIAQLAKLINESSSLFSKILEKNSFSEISRLLNISVSDYWKTHYQFDKPSTFSEKKMGNQTKELILINAIIPILFVYGQHIDNDDYKQRALDFLEKIPSENNEIIQKWKATGIKCDNAYTSQALIHLKNNYCDQRKCIHCQIGAKLIAS